MTSRFSAKGIAVVGYAFASFALIMVVHDDSGPLGPSWSLYLPLILSVLVGFFTARWWAIVGVIGPGAALALLELQGFSTQEEWGDRPLASPPGIATLIEFGLVILLGVGAGLLARELRRGRPGRF